MPMGYEQAAKIRQSGYLDEVSKNLLKDKSVKESFKTALSDVTKAKAVGIKEKFDPLNIAKKLSFGSSIGPALLGTLTGRSKEDIEYFSGLKSKKTKVTKAPKKVDAKESPKTILDKLYVMFKEQAEEEKTIREIKKDSAEEREVKKEKNHKEVIEILEKVGEPKEEVQKEKKEQSLFSLMKGLKNLGGIFKRGGKMPSRIPSGPGTSSKVILGSGLGLTALLAKGEAGTYDTAFGNQKTPKPLTQMTLKEVDEWQTKHPNENAAGKYQIIQDTLRGAKKQLGLKDTDVFDEKLQDRIYKEFLIGGTKRPDLNAYLTGKSDNLEAAQLDLAKEFASIPVPFDVTRPAMYGKPATLIKKGESYYGGIGKNRANTSISVEEAQQRLREQRDLNSGKLKPEDSQSKSIAIGDSLAAGMITANKIPGTAEVGAGPKKVFEMLQEYTKNNDIKGKNVFLGTGMPNNTSQSDFIEKQIALIKEKGGNPIVIGAGPGTERKPTTGQNEKLQEISKKSGATFTGPLESMFPGMRQTDKDMGLHLQPNQSQELFKKFSQPIFPVSSISNLNSNKVSSLSKENQGLTNISNNVVAQILMKNNVVSVSRAGDTQVTVLSPSENNSDSILMQSMKA